jgi:uroporphyrinogen III methyltransferase/synthase
MAADIPGNASPSVGKAAFTVVITRPAGQSNELIAQR